jgi:prephenate dehydrogenase
MSLRPTIKSIGIVGFGAFGRLMAAHLGPHFEIIACDPALSRADRAQHHVQFGELAEVGRCDLVVLAVPIGALVSVIRELRQHLRPGSIVMDVVSVKVVPTRIMTEELPSDVEIVGSHPLLGPQSARDGIAGRKVVLCPIRGRSARSIAAFLKGVLRLKVYTVTAEEHDREAAVVQGLTHLIANVLLRMEPLPTRLTTASFDLLMQATDMVRYDSAGVFHAIEHDNPFAAAVRRRFFALADVARAELDGRCGSTGGPHEAASIGNFRHFST